MRRSRIGRMIKFILVSIFSVLVSLLSLEWYFFSILTAGVFVWMYSELGGETK